jgi:hypothetical protein
VEGGTLGLVSEFRRFVALLCCPMIVTLPENEARKLVRIAQSEPLGDTKTLVLRWLAADGSRQYWGRAAKLFRDDTPQVRTKADGKACSNKP